MYFTYILYSEKGHRYYVGQSSDIGQRLAHHNGGFVKSTKPYVPWKMVGYLEKRTRSEATVLEKKLKNLNTEDLKKFINKYFENNNL